jgi:SP family general alpha glucoside:H+ symporter-like MFS transporter
MSTEILAPTERELKNFDLGSTSIVTLIRLAQQADEDDRKLKTWEALKKYKKAVLWSCLLSTALIMEGYDVVIINGFFGQPQLLVHYCRARCFG